MKILKILLALLAIILVFSNLGAANLISEWQSYEHNDFIIVYPVGYETQAEKTLYYLTKYKSKIDKITGNDVDQKVYLLLQDVGLKSNGYANPIQMKINLYTTPPLTNSALSGYKSWLREVGIHEYTHISQLTSSRDGAEVTTTIFGQ